MYRNDAFIGFCAVIALCGTMIYIIKDPIDGAGLVFASGIGAFFAALFNERECCNKDCDCGEETEETED